jgi:hypothetical protein
MPTVLKDTEECDISVVFKDAKGQPAKVDGAPAWESSDAAVVTVAASSDGMSCVATAQDVGTALVTMTADADLGSGTTPVIGTAAFVVDPGDAVIAELSPGAPRQQGAGPAPGAGGPAPTTIDPSADVGGGAPATGRRARKP